MLHFMRAGGLAMWPILILGIVSLVVAGSFAWRPTERKLGLIRPLSVATVFLSLTGTFTGLAATMIHVTTLPKFAESPKLPLYLMMGIGESISSVILGFGILSVVWILAAFGLRRQT